ncbi:type VII secretion integral membrane protein EccD [Marinactinospora thermotolerans DSM 45154]|uniref:Type VII secretion integral membrane protein EccD n=1 Tax=Marinactinospora thermotolerans DSM 45154 TaxID=1122192 RepID=A0A1T4R3D6_9ACTN|nr:type VII secretion integral membrane protein EccD [Marinactinospora thermotolerans]SKA10345.1 type VII secretion integral membrane protein EccD [Marinactinospora thermotolerans DSM 45154]
MTAWSRVTLVGGRRRVDAVLPAREPVGALMPEVLHLLGDEVDGPARPLHLATASGAILDGESTLADRGIPDGAVLRLVRAEDPLPAPVVHEVPEAAGDALDGHRDRWNPEAARWTATAVLTALTLVVGHFLRVGIGGGTGVTIAAVAALLLFLTGPAIGPTWREPLGTALSIAGAVLGGYALWAGADLHAWPAWARWGGTALLAGLLVILLGLISRLGRGGLIGGGALSLLAMLWPACALLGLDAARTGAVAAVVCVVLLGVILRAASALSGLTALDDRRSAGGEVSRGDVMAALTATHRSMAIAVVAVAVCAAGAGVGLASEFDGWTAALSALFAVVVAGRSRMYPLASQKVSLLAAALVVLTAAALAWREEAAWAVWPVVAVLLLIAIIPVVVLTREQPEHVRARLRRIAGRIEAVAVVALIPVTIGVFGTYGRLLTTF